MATGSRAAPAPPRLAPALWLVALLGAAALVATAWRLSAGLAPGDWWAALTRPATPGELVFASSGLPRAATAALCGAALALAGGLTQAVLGNPLAVPGTLGVTAGAQVAVLAAALLAPEALGLPREAAALAGGLAGLGIVFAVAAAGRFSTLSLVLAGLAVGLFCAALAGVLKLLNHEYLGAIALWGGGSLAQADWRVPAGLAPRLLALALLAGLLVRPVTLMGLSDAGARGLGLSLATFRLAALAVAAALATVVTAAVGVITFVDVAAPLAVRLAGARRLGPRLALATGAGAAILCLVDAGVQALNARYGAFLPTGAATGALAAPLVIALLPRLRGDASAPAPAAPVPRAARPARILLGLAGAGVGFALLALAVGRTGSGWSLPGMDGWAALLPWRVPRTLTAFAAGAALGTAGALLQRMTGNPIASPESLGIGAAATAGFALALLLDPAPTPALLLAAGGGGALALTGLLVLAAHRARFAPDHLLIAGVALSAALNALLIAFLALNDGRAALLTAWMAGSTAGAGPGSAILALGGAALAVPAALVFARPLDLMPLGDAVAAGAGVALAPMRLGVAALAALLTAGAVLLVGPLTFAGLLGPQVAGRLGLTRAATLLRGAALVGGGVTVAADALGRVVAAPFDIPAGLTAALIGIPAFLLLVGHRARRG